MEKDANLWTANSMVLMLWIGFWSRTMIKDSSLTTVFLSVSIAETQIFSCSPMNWGCNFCRKSEVDRYGWFGILYIELRSYITLLEDLLPYARVIFQGWEIYRFRARYKEGYQGNGLTPIKFVLKDYPTNFKGSWLFKQRLSIWIWWGLESFLMNNEGTCGIYKIFITTIQLLVSILETSMNECNH